ncbi:hypothetical protein T09_2155, partial [Trichinella sp. T9]
LTKSMFLLLRFLSHSRINVLIGRIEQCISPVDCGIALVFCYVCEHGNIFYSLCLCNEEPFTLDFGKSYLLQRVETYLSSATNAIDQQPIRQPTYPPFVHSLVACSTSLLSSPYAL